MTLSQAMALLLWALGASAFIVLAIVGAAALAAMVVDWWRE